MNTKTITLDGERITVERFGQDDYCIAFDEADCSVRGTMLDIVRSFAEWQFSVMAEPAVSFEHGDQTISNPWIDTSARFPLTSTQASDTYGLENLLQFIMDAVELLRPND
jgi:hypothetical protein